MFLENCSLQNVCVDDSRYNICKNIFFVKLTSEWLASEQYFKL